MFIITGPVFEQSAVCVPILRALPEWFGIEAALIQYASEIDRLPTFLASSPAGVSGFLSLKLHYPYSAEVYVMGVRPESQHSGIGRALMEESQSWLKQQGCEYLQVKTLGPSVEDLNYVKTRAFYEAMGFRPLEELKQIWDENNPCLILVKRL